MVTKRPYSWSLGLILGAFCTIFRARSVGTGLGAKFGRKLAKSRNKNYNFLLPILNEGKLMRNAGSFGKRQSRLEPKAMVSIDGRPNRRAPPDDRAIVGTLVGANISRSQTIVTFAGAPLVPSPSARLKVLFEARFDFFLVPPLPGSGAGSGRPFPKENHGFGAGFGPDPGG
jgi:hypothetical protein